MQETIRSLVKLTMPIMMSVGCGASQEDPPLPEQVDVDTQNLELYEAANDPTLGGPVTVCNVGGVSMHCCPNWQTGKTHYVMVGLNLSTNTFRCARLINSSTNMGQVTLAPAGTYQLQDGTKFLPACPSGQAMVGLHWDLKRAACTSVNPGNFGLVGYVDITQPDATGMKYCQPAFGGSTTAGSLMNGIAENYPNRKFLRCLH